MSETPDDGLVVLAMPVREGVRVAYGSKMVHCDICGGHVWVSPFSQTKLKEGATARCIDHPRRPGSKILPPSPETAAEVLEVFARDN